MLPWQNVLPGIAKKLSSSNPCRGMECKQPTTIYMGPRNRRNVLPWQHLLPRIVEKLVSSNLCWVMECKEPTKMFIYRSKKEIKCCHGKTDCRKSNRLQSMQGFRMQRTHKEIFKPKKHEKVLLSTHKITS